MNQEVESGVDSTEQPGRKLLWAYGIVGLLALLLVWRLFAGGSDTPQAVETVEEGNPFTTCLLMLQSERATEKAVDFETTAPHPFFGPLNCKGWILFNVMHANVHVRQMQRIKNSEGYPAN